MKLPHALSYVPWSVRVTLRIWADIGLVLFMLVTYPIRVVLRARRLQPASLPRAIVNKTLDTHSGSGQHHAIQVRSMMRSTLYPVPRRTVE